LDKTSHHAENVSTDRLERGAAVLLVLFWAVHLGIMLVRYDVIVFA
jgi:hypothetical protein